MLTLSPLNLNGFLKKKIFFSPNPGGGIREAIPESGTGEEKKNKSRIK